MLGSISLSAQSFRFLNQSPFPEVRNQILSFNFDSASVLLKQNQPSKELEAVRQYYQAVLIAWNYLLTENELYYDNFRDRENGVVSQLEKYDDKAEFKFLLGEFYLWKTIVLFRNNSFVTAVYNGNSSYNYYVAAAKQEPNNWDIKKGIGLAHFFIGMVPEKYNWIASLFGFSGTMDQGLNELIGASTNGTYSQDDATFFLSAIQLYVFRDSKKSLTYLQPLLSKYPNNGLFIMTAALAYQRDRNVLVAKSTLQDKLDFYEMKFPAFAELVRFRLGECLFFLGDYENAEKTLKLFLKNYKVEALKPLAYYRLGITLEMLGKHDEAVVNFKKIVPREKFEFEQFAKLESQKYVLRPMTFDEKKLWEAKNEFDCGNIDNAIKLSEQMLGSNISDVETKGEFYYRLGRMYEEKGDFERAITYYNLTLKTPFKLYTWLGAYSWFQIGKVNVKMNKITEAQFAFTQAKKYPSHAFEDSLLREIDTELKKINTAKKK